VAVHLKRTGKGGVTLRQPLWAMPFTLGALNLVLAIASLPVCAMRIYSVCAMRI